MTNSHSEPDHCETPGRPFVVSYSAENHRAVVFMPDCGMWSCPYCAEQRAVEWRMHAWKGASDLMAQGRKMAFVTLTSRGGRGRTREASLEAFRVGFPRLRERLKYAVGEYEYLAIPEQHKNGVVHFHLIVDVRMSNRWWKDKSFAVGLGYMAKSKSMVNPIEAPYYVSKYIGKEFAGVEWPKGFRRVRASRGWPKIAKPGKVDKNEYTAHMTPHDAWWRIHELRDAGVDVEIRKSAEGPLMFTS